MIFRGKQSCRDSRNIEVARGSGVGAGTDTQLEHRGFGAVTLFCMLRLWQIQDITHFSELTELQDTKDASPHFH